MRNTLSDPVPHENSSESSDVHLVISSLFFDVILCFTKKLNGSGEIKCEWLELISPGL